MGVAKTERGTRREVPRRVRRPDRAGRPHPSPRRSSFSRRRSRYYVVGQALPGSRPCCSSSTGTSTRCSELVTAADAGPKPFKGDFDKFCQLVHASAVSDVNAISIMKAAKCTAGCTSCRQGGSPSFSAAGARPVGRGRHQGPRRRRRDQGGLYQGAVRAVLGTRRYEQLHRSERRQVPEVGGRRQLGCARWTGSTTSSPTATPGNLGGVGGVAQADLVVPDPGRCEPARHPLRGEGRTDRAFLRGPHLRALRVLSTANIRRGGGNQPSTMWPVGTTAANVRQCQRREVVGIAACRTEDASPATGGHEGHPSTNPITGRSKAMAWNGEGHSRSG